MYCHIFEKLGIPGLRRGWGYDGCLICKIFPTAITVKSNKPIISRRHYLLETSCSFEGDVTTDHWILIIRSHGSLLFRFHVQSLSVGKYYNMKEDPLSVECPGKNYSFPPMRVFSEEPREPVPWVAISVWGPKFTANSRKSLVNIAELYNIMFPYVTCQFPTKTHL